LHHHAVDLVVDRMPIALPALAEAEHRFERAHLLGPRVNGQPRLPEIREDLGMPLEPAAFHRTHSMAPQAKGPGRGDGRVLLPEGAGRAVPRIGEDLLPSGGELLVQLLERLDRQIDLASRLQEPWMARRAAVAAKPHGNGPDRTD